MNFRIIRVEWIKTDKNFERFQSSALFSPRYGWVGMDFFLIEFFWYVFSKRTLLGRAIWMFHLEVPEGQCLGNLFKWGYKIWWTFRGEALISWGIPSETSSATTFSIWGWFFVFFAGNETSPLFSMITTTTRATEHHQPPSTWLAIRAAPGAPNVPPCRPPAAPHDRLAMANR